MATDNDLLEVLETSKPERLATGLIFTDGPLRHPVIEARRRCAASVVVSASESMDSGPSPAPGSAAR